MIHETARFPLVRKSPESASFNRRSPVQVRKLAPVIQLDSSFQARGLVPRHKAPAQNQRPKQNLPTLKIERAVRVVPTRSWSWRSMCCQLTRCGSETG